MAEDALRDMDALRHMDALRDTVALRHMDALSDRGRGVPFATIARSSHARQANGRAQPLRRGSRRCFVQASCSRAEHGPNFKNEFARDHDEQNSESPNANIRVEGEAGADDRSGD
ncbi:MAG: hypothetical protein RL591_2327 [Planctomycetota bacterium]